MTPLTQEQINALVMEVYANRHTEPATPETIVRAVERAHGIYPASCPDCEGKGCVECDGPDHRSA